MRIKRTARSMTLPARVARCAASAMLGLLPALLAAPALAETDEAALAAGPLTLRGFGTLGLARTDEANAEFVRDLSQPHGASPRTSMRTDSRFGLQANWRAGEHLELVAQAVSRYRHDADFQPKVTWAFARFSPTPHLDLRIGRVGTEFYMLADSRDVGYSYLTVRPPVDYYGTLPFSNIDGADIGATLPLAGGLLRGKLFWGRDPEFVPVGNDRIWDLHGSRISGGHVDYLRGSWQWRLGYSQLRFKQDVPLADIRGILNAVAQATGVEGAARAADQLSTIGKKAQLFSAGVVFDEGPVQVQLMLSQTRHNSAVYQNTRAGYVIGGYRIGSVTPFAGYSWSVSKDPNVRTGLPDVPPFDVLNATLQSTIAETYSNQETWTFGARWDLRRNLALKAQADVVRGQPASIFLTRNERPGFDGRYSVFSLSLDFVF